MDGIDDTIGRLSELGEVTARSLFGGHGIYWRDMIFGIVSRGRLYLTEARAANGIQDKRKRAKGRGKKAARPEAFFALLPFSLSLSSR
jgi:TfoX/Sxy family transcriptional regulator of competence genes